MESATISKTVSPSGVRYYLNGKRIGAYVYSQFSGNANYRQDCFLTTIRKGVIRHSSSIYKL